MEYKIYCLLKTERADRVLRTKVIAECISEAITKAKALFQEKLKDKKFHIFMYETSK